LSDCGRGRHRPDDPKPQELTGQADPSAWKPIYFLSPCSVFRNGGENHPFRQLDKNLWTQKRLADKILTKKFKLSAVKLY
jgi:hypothetical protein